MHCQLTYAKLSSSSVGCCHLCLPLLRLCFFFPTHSLSLSSPSPFSTQVCLWTSVHFLQNRCSVNSIHQVKSTSVWNYTTCLTGVYSQTHSLKARLWEVSQPFPHFQKECGALHAFCVELESARVSYIGS